MIYPIKGWEGLTSRALYIKLHSNKIENTRGSHGMFNRGCGLFYVVGIFDFASQGWSFQ